MSNVYFDITVNGVPKGRIVFKLFDDIVPKTAKNFRTLATHENGYGYRNSFFHRVVPKSILEGGDITKHNGTGGKSIYGEKFKAENFILKHDRPFLLSMTNIADPNGSRFAYDSRFFITVVANEGLDGKHVVFGEVVDGEDLVNEISDLGDSNGFIGRKKIQIADCGVVA